MHLKTLIMTGFKSFPEKIRLEFNTGITAVVGPNGSGKSNISDAVRWVLGEQSAKSLRGGKMEDVIFSGTENRHSLGFAEVSMVIDNTDRRMKTEYSEITITRRMYRSGEGEYKINGVACRLKDIHEMFMDTGVGREGYSIIGQGRIEEILSARSEDRRLLFEEAAGIVKYKSRRQEASTKLEREKQNLSRVDDIIAELEMRLEPLKGQAAKAELHLKLKEQLKTVQVNIFLSQAQSAEKQLADLDENIRILGVQREAEEARRESQNQRHELLRSDVAGAEEKLRSLDEEKENARGLSEQARVAIKVSEERISSMLKAEDGLAARIGKNKAQMAAKNQSLSDVRGQKSLLELEGKALNGQLQASQHALDTFSEGLSENDQKLEILNAALMDRMKASLDLKNKIERVESQLELLAERKEALRAEGEECDLRAVEAGALLRESKAAADDTANRMGALLSHIQELQKSVGGLNALSGQIALDESATIRKLSEAESRHTVLSDMERGFEGYRRSSKAVLKRGAELKGIRGAVAELARVSEAYETAVETALGASAHDIVTETEEDAVAAIEYLKQAKEGRATFLPMNAISPRSLGKDKAAILAGPGVIGTADALVSHDPEYGNIFRHLLGAVVVVENSAIAIELSKKYKRGLMIVTPAGEVFSPGGSITGGSSQARGGLISRTRELNDLKSTIAELRGKASSCRVEADKAKSQAAAETAEIEETRKEWQALLLENNTQQNKCKQLEGASSELNKKLLNIAEEREKFTAREDEGFKNLSTLHSALNAEERGIAAARSELGERSRSATGDRQKRDEQVKALAELRIQASGLEQRVHTSEESIKRLESEIAAMLSDKGALERELSASHGEREKLSAEAEANKQALETAQGRLSELSAAIESMSGQLESLKAQLSETEQRRQAGAEAIAGLNNEAAMLGMRREQLEAETRRLYDDIWDEYEVTAQTAKDYETLDMAIGQMNREERRLKNELSGIGDVNIGAIEEYKAVGSRFEFLSAQRSDILSAEERLLAAIAELTGLMEKQFAEQFAVISQNFSAVFREMFSGGKARLVLSGNGNILESGIEIEVQPPGKNLQSMSLLSGGERALTAAALLFGILRMKPSPFCILDEIEAALDEANVNRFADYLRKISNETQFILITHRKGTMEAADTLYGVTMQEVGVSKLVSVRLEEATA